ncbi:MAG: hypothetical protein ACKO7Z_07375 [Cyanobacteriota bacterium]
MLAGAAALALMLAAQPAEAHDIADRGTTAGDLGSHDKEHAKEINKRFPFVNFEGGDFSGTDVPSISPKAPVPTGAVLFFNHSQQHQTDPMPGTITHLRCQT